MVIRVTLEVASSHYRHNPDDDGKRRNRVFSWIARVAVASVALVPDVWRMTH